MINMDSWGHSYSIVRGEILGFMHVKAFPMMFLFCSYIVVAFRP